MSVDIEEIALSEDQGLAAVFGNGGDGGGGGAGGGAGGGGGDGGKRMQFSFGERRQDRWEGAPNDHRAIPDGGVVYGEAAAPAHAAAEAEAEHKASFNLEVQRAAHLVTPAARVHLIVDAKAHGGRTPLHVAVSRGLGKIAAALLAEGASAEMTDDGQSTPLHLAAEIGHVEIAVLLVGKYGASINTKNGAGKTPVEVAEEGGHEEFATRMEAQGIFGYDEGWGAGGNKDNEGNKGVEGGEGKGDDGDGGGEGKTDGGGGAGGGGGGGPPMWHCQQCSYANLVGSGECEVCHAKPPASLRVVSQDPMDRTSQHTPSSMASTIQNGCEALSAVLEIPLGWAQRLLEAHAFDLRASQNAWHADPAVACEKAGLPNPAVLADIAERMRAREAKRGGGKGDGDDGDGGDGGDGGAGGEGERGRRQNLNTPWNDSTGCCAVCYDDFEDESKSCLRDLGCAHAICAGCWTNHLEGEILDKARSQLRCPACTFPVPQALIEDCVSARAQGIYANLVMDAFISREGALKRCPGQDCNDVVERFRRKAGDDSWKCGVCDAINEPDAPACQICTCTRGEGIAVAPEGKAEGVEGGVDAEDGHQTEFRALMRNSERVSPWVAGMSVKELKMMISDAGQSHADCFEKSELRKRAAEALLGKDRKAEAELRAMFEKKKGMDGLVAKERKVAEEDKAITFNQVNCVTGPHFWCFECGEQPHDPLSCGLWHAFLDNAKSKMGVDLITGAQDGGVLNKLNEQWLKRNTKACPKCKTDILKADGCNHMTCGVKSCKHQWCWICLADWNGHGGSVYDCAKAGNGKAGKADDVNKQIAKNLAESKDAIGAGADYVGFLAQEDSRNLEAKWLTQERISKRMDDLQVLIRLCDLCAVYFVLRPSYAFCWVRAHLIVRMICIEWRESHCSYVRAPLCTNILSLIPPLHCTWLYIYRSLLHRRSQRTW